MQVWRIVLPSLAFAVLAAAFIAYDDMAAAAPAPGTGAVDAKACPFAKDGKKDGKKDWPADSAVARHIAFFTQNQDGQTLTAESMTWGHTIQKIFSGVSLKVAAILKLLKDQLLSPTTDDLLKVNNPAASGIWSKDGKFDEKAFQGFVDGASFFDDKEKKRILTRESVRKWMNNKWAGHKFGVATWIRLAYVIPIPVSWTAVTSGSFDELFLYYSDCTFTDPYAAQKVTAQNALTVERLREFYTNSFTVMEKRAAAVSDTPVAKS
jgi:hypothetical protein